MKKMIIMLVAIVVLLFAVVFIAVNQGKVAPGNFIGPLQKGVVRVSWLKLDESGRSKIAFIHVSNKPYGR